jgi:hypothetical protein
MTHVVPDPEQGEGPPACSRRGSFAVSAAQDLWLLSLFLLASCITLTPRSRTAGAAAAVIPDMPMQKWGIESCGAGSLSTVLRHYGDETTMQQWDATLPKTRGGVMTVDLLLAARQKGYDARLVTGTPDIIVDELRNNRPVILMLKVIDSLGRSYDFYHYIVVDGVDVDGGLVRTQFGDGRARWVSMERIEKAWSGGGHTAILIHPRTAADDVAAALRAAVALEDQGKFAEAAERYRAITTAHPDSVVAWTDLGNAEAHLGRRDQAERAFRRALDIDGNARDALNNLAWLLFEEKRLDDAERLARKALAQPGPDDYLVLDTLARVLAAKGACGEAMRTFQQAIDAVPSSRAAARTDLENALSETQRACRS